MANRKELPLGFPCYVWDFLVIFEIPKGHSYFQRASIISVVSNSEYYISSFSPKNVNINKCKKHSVYTFS